MTEEEIAELRSRIAEVEDDFSKRANILLDDILLTREQADKNTRAIDNLAQLSSESRRDIDQLAARMGELAQSVSDLRSSVSEVSQNVQLVAFSVSQVSESMNILRQTQQAFVEQAVADRQSFQTEIQRIWEYLLLQHPNNGRGEPGGEG